MRAIIYKDYGPHDVLELAERETPSPASSEILIEVHAAGVNPVDARLRKGEMRVLLPGGFPRIPGYDVAGVVVQEQSEGRFRVGDRVVAFLDHIYGGGYAEFATCTNTSVSAIPADMSFEAAAGLPLAGCTALQSLRDFGKLEAGDTVLINGASGGGGSMAIQIAKAYGAQVTAVASGKHEAFTRSLGADEFINYHQHDVTELDEKWDIIFDVAGKLTFSSSRDRLTSDGNFVSTEPSLRGLIISLLSWPLEKQSHVMLARSRQEDLDELLNLHTNGQLQIHVEEFYDLQDAAAAHRCIEEGGFCGKLVLQVATDS